MTVGGLVSVQRRDGQRFYWCLAAFKRTTKYADNIRVACGGVIVCTGGISMTEPVTCPDCLAGRKWGDRDV